MKKKNRKIILYIPHKNCINEATNMYIKLIISGIKGDYYGYTTKLHKLKNYDVIITITNRAAIIAKLFNHKKIIVNWFQGISPEECLLLSGSKLKFSIKRIFEYFSLRFSDYKFFVSDQMKTHYENCYKLKLDNYIVMPCFNKNLNKNQILKNIDKYKTNSFVYAGSLHKWQCFEKTLKIYKSLSSYIDSTSITILTHDVNSAKHLCRKLDIKNFNIKSCTLDEVDTEISKYKFGFLIRDNITVNNVATPTKMNTYLSVGTIPIFSDSLYEFTKKMPNRIGIKVKSNDDLQKIVSTILENINIVNEFTLDSYINLLEVMFNDYYSYTKYTDKISVLNI